MGEIRLLNELFHIDSLGWVTFWIGLLEEFLVSAGSEPVAARSQTIVQLLVVGFSFLPRDIFNRINGLG
jgi:hypothetical protein